MSQLGVGAIIGFLGGNEESVKAIRASLGKTIAGAVLDKADDGEVRLTFTDGSVLSLADAGRSCCESRYVTTEDDLSRLAGEVLADVSIAEAPDMPDEHGEPHEVQFLNVQTDKGRVQFVTHNKHNGYYGGFWIEARLTPKHPETAR